MVPSEIRLNILLISTLTSTNFIFLANCIMRLVDEEALNLCKLDVSSSMETNRPLHINNKSINDNKLKPKLLSPD